MEYRFNSQIPPQAPQIPAPIIAPSQPQETGIAASVGRWIHRHKDSTDKPVGFVTYQVIRNALAAIPYGIATVLVSDGFNKMTSKAVENNSPNVARFLRSPVKDVAMIAAGFTLYRGTLKLVRYVKESLFDPKDSEAQTIDEVRHIGSTIAEKVKEIAPAEINSTPYGAIALGMGRRFLPGIEGYTARPAENIIAAGTHPRTVGWNKDGIGLSFTTPDGKKGLGNWFKDMGNRVFSKKSMPIAEGLTFIGSFLAFFELSDRLYKDVQVRRGTWHGEDNSIARKAPPKHGDLVAVSQTNDPNEHRGKHPETFGGDPSPKSLLFGRILPTVFGIGAYTLTKRMAYYAMGHFAGKNTFWKRAFVEGAATSTFFVMTSSADIFEKINAKLFGKKEAPKPAALPVYTASVPVLREDAPATEVLAEATADQAPKAQISQPAVNEGTVSEAPEKLVATA